MGGDRLASLSLSGLTIAPLLPRRAAPSDHLSVIAVAVRPDDNF